MVQCEMCGAETSSPTTVKVEGAELQVCSSCTEFGTEVRTEEESSTTTKYSTSSSSGGSTSDGGESASGGSSPSRSRSRSDMFDEMEEIVPDYDGRIREAREALDLTQAELADDLNEKTSLIRKLERGESLPSDTIRRKLERKLDISLVEGSGGESDADWESGDGGSGMTLGDVVKRKD